MRKNQFLCLAFGFVSACGANVVANPAVAAPKSATKAASATNSSVITAKEAQQLADNVLRETSALRGLSIKKRVPCTIQSRAATSSMLQESMKKSVSSDQLKAMTIYLKQLNLTPDKFDLPAYYLKMMDEQLAGYYDSQTGKFYTTSRVDRLQLQTVMAHELTHALQDQHFDLSRLEKWPAHDSDARLAMQSLVEGDATLAMSQYTTRNPFRSLALLASTLFAGESSATFKAAPLVLQESLTFPYLSGLTFVSALYKSGGWPAVNGAFENLPASSEQIIHPEKFIAHEKPVAAPLRDLTPQLGRGWKLLDHDVNGEFGLYLMFKAGLNNPAQAAQAAAGWAGDRYAIYSGPNGANLVTQVTIWDSNADAQQFSDAYIRLAATRTKTKSTLKNNALLWRAGSSIIWLQRRANKVIVLEGASLNHNPETLSKPLWK